MAWNSDKAKAQHYIPAYIDKETLAASKSDTYISSAGKLLMDKAIELMNAFRQEKINITLKRLDGTEYSSKAVISVRQASSYDREKGKEVALVKRDGTAIMSPCISIKTSADDTVIMYAKEDISNGIVIQNMTVKTWADGKPRLYRLSEIKDDNILCAPTTRAVLKSILSKDIIREKKSERSQMEELTIELNRFFSSAADKVYSAASDEKGSRRLVNNSYAQYVSDNYGEKCILRSHNDNIVVELGVTGEGNRYARATNFDRPVETSEGTRYESLFINNTADLENLSDEAIIRAVAAYKKISMPDKYEVAAEQSENDADD